MRRGVGLGPRRGPAGAPVLDLDPEADVGIQLYGSIDGKVLRDEACGAAAPGDPLRPDTLCSLWCATKPVAAVYLLTLTERYGVGLDDPVADLLEGGRVRPPAHVTVRSLLDHSAGLQHPSAVEVMLTPPVLRHALVDARLADAVPAPAYSEYVAWDLVGRAIASLTGTCAPVAIDDWLHALGLGDELVFNAATLVRDRIGVFHLRVGGAWFPLNQDRSIRLRADDRVALGGYASARGLGHFYELLLRHRRQPVVGVASPPLLEQVLGRARPPAVDATLGKACSFAGGFMVHLEEHGYGELPSGAAFGHSGLLGSSAGFADPATDTVVVVSRNALSFDEEWAGVRRRQLFETILPATARSERVLAC